MTFTINLSVEQQRRLSAKAAQAGHELSAYVHQLIDRDLETESLDAILAPVRRNFDQSGS
jgi:predicted DNA-binding protein